MEKAASAYHLQLLDGGNLTGHRGASEYLARRAITQPDIEQFCLGFVTEPLPGDEQFAGRIAIPYLTPSGVRAIKYRCIADHDCKTSGGEFHHKYAQAEGQEQHLYNVAAYHSGLDVIGVTEGEFNAQAATVHLGLPTLGVPGAQQWKKHGWFWKLAFMDFSTVIIFADGDRPRCHCNPRHKEACPTPKRVGLELAKQIRGDAGGNARIVRCPDDQDVNSMVVAGRVDELKRKAGL